MDFADDLVELEGGMSSPDLPELHEMFDFDGASHVSVRSQSGGPSQHVLSPSVPPSSDGGRSESRIPWARAILEDAPSDDEDGLFDDGLDSASDDEPEEAVSMSAEPPKWKIHHSRGDHRLNGMCVSPVLAELTGISARLYRPDTVDRFRWRKGARHAAPT
jgi:hypothetical protein